MEMSIWTFKKLRLVHVWLKRQEHHLQARVVELAAKLLKFWFFMLLFARYMDMS
jgi:hypothetical protein